MVVLVCADCKRIYNPDDYEYLECEDCGGKLKLREVIEEVVLLHNIPIYTN
jgi:DNA-directed RNA polymerase subunit RPC12/RpoP